MDNETYLDEPVITDESTESSFALELAKTAGLSVATTVGTLVGMVAVGYGVDRVRVFREKRAAKKAAATQETTPTEA